LKSAPRKKIFLGIETTTDIFSVAVSVENRDFDEIRVEGRKHSEKLIPNIDKLLKKAALTPKDLTAVGMGVGPGSFTGIRVGLSCGLTMSQILGIPAYGISSLDLAGKNSPNPVIKAYRDKYYTADYNDKGERTSDFRIIDENEKKAAGAMAVEISAVGLVKEMNDLYNKYPEADWKDIEPIYIMETEYKPKKQEI